MLISNPLTVTYLRVCLVGLKTRWMKNREKMNNSYVWLGREGVGEIVGSGSFLFKPAKIKSPQFRVKTPVKMLCNILDKIAQANVQIFLPFCPFFLRFFCLFIIRFFLLFLPFLFFNCAKPLMFDPFFPGFFPSFVLIFIFSFSFVFIFQFFIYFFFSFIMCLSFLFSNN